MPVKQSEDAVVIEPAQPAGAVVIWLHGLGADGHDFVPLVDQLELPPEPAVRFIFPHAPMRAVAINAGMRMRAWYDILALSRSAKQDTVGIRNSEALVQRYILQQRDAGIPAARIFIAGFSQGGAMALHVALRYPERLGGVLALSTYLPLDDLLEAEASGVNRDLPILMCHGTFDAVLPHALGETSCNSLRQAGYAVQWHSYPMQHQVCAEEISDISRWLNERFK